MLQSSSRVGSAYSGGVLPGGGGLPVRGGSAYSGGRGGGSAWSGEGLPVSGGFSLLGGGLPGPGGGGSAWSRGGPARRTPPVDRITDTCKTITLATTSLRPVKIYCLHV